MRVYLNLLPWVLATASINAQTVPFSVYLNFNNPSCVTGNTCFPTVYRTVCNTNQASSCAAWTPTSAAYTKLPASDSAGNSYTTSTVSSTGTTFKYRDDGTISKNLGYGVMYQYAVTNSFAAYPSNASPATVVNIITPIAHQATLNYSNGACTSASLQCSIQVYRAQCSSSTSCPSYSPGSSSFKALNMLSNLTSTVGTQGTSWVYQDLDVVLANSTTYVWVATNTFVNGSTPSAASSPYIGTTAATRSKGVTNAKPYVVPPPTNLRSVAK